MLEAQKLIRWPRLCLSMSAGPMKLALAAVTLAELGVMLAGPKAMLAGWPH